MSKLKTFKVEGSNGVSYVLYYPTDRTLYLDDGTMVIFPPAEPDLEWEEAFDNDDPEVLEQLIEQRAKEE